VNAKPRVTPGVAYPLGATLTTGGVNFAVYSEHARRVMVSLFDGPDGSGEIVLDLSSRTGHVWHGFVPGIGSGQHYGFRADGPYQPRAGHWFNPAKLLVDPYAHALDGELDWSGPIFAHQTHPHTDHSVCDLHDSAGYVPMSVVIDHVFDWDGTAPPRTPLSETIIYETHVKGATMSHPDIERGVRGTYAGFVEPAFLRHLESLGVSAVELLPIQQFVDEAFLVEAGLRNYWGYNPIGFFAPMARYARAGHAQTRVNEVKAMIRELHRHGLEVILDVVFNHTAEGGQNGPLLSLKGLDNATYYRLDLADRSRYVDHSGTGNSLAISHPATLRVVLDALRHWVRQYHVDGFRFDLATVLGRDSTGFSARSHFFTSIAQDPVLQGVKLIAEPWDVGTNGYQLGHFPVGWSEWNDRFRDTIRSFWLGHHVRLGDVALRLAGSADLFDRPGKGPFASVNLVTAHDGFALTDLVSYSHKHNEANGEANGDGHNHNLSRNFGVEGPTTDQHINARRHRARRNLLATTLLSHGVPMVLGGDELSRTQRGNNNAYPQDNDITWFDWTLDADRSDFLEFTRRLVRLRREHPALRRRTFLDAESPVVHAPDEISWRDADGHELSPHEWDRDAPRTLQLLMCAASTDAEDESVCSLLLLLNADPEPTRFAVMVNRADPTTSWQIVLDTARPTGEPGRGESVVPGQSLLVQGESLVLLCEAVR
jgi:isoamylase